MPFFSKKNKTPSDTKDIRPKDNDLVSDIQEKKPVAISSEAKKLLSLGYGVIIAPYITEKASMLVNNNTYVFKIAGTADKFSVRRAIEVMYKVNVTKVRMVTIHSKKRMFGRNIGTKAGFKKALVTLRQGDRIDVFNR